MLLLLFLLAGLKNRYRYVDDYSQAKLQRISLKLINFVMRNIADFEFRTFVSFLSCKHKQVCS